MDGSCARIACLPRSQFEFVEHTVDAIEEGRKENVFSMGDSLLHGPSGDRDHSRSSTMTSYRADGSLSSASANLQSSAAVVSMLKTTTEMGDIGQVTGSNRFQKHSRAGRSANGQTPSRTSSHYSQRTASIKSGTSNQSFRNQGHGSARAYHQSREQLHGSRGLLNHRGFSKSQEFPPRNADSRSVGTSDNFRSFTLTGPPADRTFSFTRSGLEHSRVLNGQRSIQNLRSNIQFPRPHSPYNNPPRHPRPGYRGASPALSDTISSAARPTAQRPELGPRSFTSFTHQRQGGRHPHPLHQNEVQTGNSAYQPHRFAAITRPPNLASDSKHNDRNFSNPTSPSRTNTPPTVSMPVAPELAPEPLKLRQTTIGGHVEKSEGKPARVFLRDSAPHVGFVQRVKTALESHAPREQDKKQYDLAKVAQSAHNTHNLSSTTHVDGQSDDVVPNKLTRDMIKAAVEPSCEVTINPLTPEKAEIKRLTREFVKAAVGGSEDLKHKESQDTFDIVVFGSETVKSSFDERSLLAGHSGLPKSSTSSGEKEEAQADEVTAGSLDASATEYSHLTSTNSPYRSIPKPVDEQEPDYDTGVEDNTSQEEQPKLSDVDGGKEQVPDLTSPFRPKSMPFRIKHLTPLAKSFSQQQTRQSCPSTRELRFTGTSVEEEKGRVTQSIGYAHHLSQLSILDGFLPDAADSNDADMPKPLKPTKIIVEPPVGINYEDVYIPDQEFNQFDSRHNSSETPRVSISSSSEFRRMSTYLGSETRQSGLRSYNSQLPDLAEDSQESASTTNLRMLGARPPVFKTLGNRSRPETKQPSRVFVPPKVTQSYLRRSLAAVGKIPSFKFSRTDLTTKLNLALGIRSSRSMDDLSSLPSSRTSAWLEERAVSVDMLRYRYASFFIRAESKENMSEVPPPPPPTLSKRSSQDGFPERDKALLQEINRLSIPSVDILNVRLSEFLPTLETGTEGVDADVEAEEHLEPGTGKLTKDETGIAEAKDSRVQSFSVTRPAIETTEKSKVSKFRLDQELPPLTDDINELTSYRLRLKNPMGSRDTSLEANRVQRKAFGDTNAGSTGLARSYRTPRGVARPRASTQTQNDAPRSSPSPRAGTSSTSLDINFGRRRVQDTKSGKGKIIRKTRSNVENPESSSIRIARTMSPMPRFDANLVPAVETFNNHEDGTTTTKDRLLGSLGRKMGFKTRTADRSGFKLDPSFLHGTDRTSAVVPGDRYPTSSLTSPDVIVVDENRSFFSDDSSQLSLARENRASLRKRLTRLKPKRSSTRPPVEIEEFRSSNNILDPSSTSASLSPRAGPALGGQGYNTHFEFESSEEAPPGGMGKFEFHVRRAFERLRGWTLRCGEMFPFNMGKKKQPPPWYAHHEDSLMYSGV